MCKSVKHLKKVAVPIVMPPLPLLRIFLLCLLWKRNPDGRLQPGMLLFQNLKSLSLFIAFALTGLSAPTWAACTPTSERVTSGTFPTSGGNTNTVTGWTVGGTYAASGPWASPTGRVNLGANGLTFQRDASTVTTLSQGVTTINEGSKITLSNLSWLRTLQYGPTGNAIFTVSYAGTVYATIDTRAITGATASSTQTPTVTASNGASVNIATLPSITGAAYQTSTPTTLTITLPTVVASSGQLLFTFTANSDPGEVNDILLKSVSMLSCPNPKLTLTKVSNGGVGAFQFTGSNGWTSQTITTTVSGSGVAGALQTLTAAATSTTITEAAVAGYTLTSANCTGLGSGGSATLSGNTLTLDAAATAAGSNIVCTFTNDKTPLVRIKKRTVGKAGGPFTFSQTGLAATPGSITTTTLVAEPASPAAINATVGSAVTLTEASNADYGFGGISCTDANAGITGNTTAVTSSTASITIPAGNIVGGADYTCTFTNNRIPIVKVLKTTLGGFGGPFAFAQTNLAAAPPSVTTTAAATATPAVASATATKVTTTGSPVTIQETVASGFFITSASCSDENTANTGNPASFGTLSGTTLTIPAANVVSGAEIVCIFTNTHANPSLEIVKTANTAGPVIVGEVITYTYEVRNSGNVAITSVSVSDAHNGSGTLVGPQGESLLTDVAPTGDSSDAGLNATWDTLAPGDTVRFMATYTTTQRDVDLLQ